MGYILKCTVCAESFTSTKDWLNHLLQVKHQAVARKEVEESWTQNPNKENVIVIYSSIPVACLEDLEYFSRGNPLVVSDFVFWEERPTRGLIFLQNSDKVEVALEGGCLVRLCNRYATSISDELVNAQPWKLDYLCLVNNHYRPRKVEETF